MSSREIVSLAFRSVRSNWLRATLTLLIIAFGIMALVAVQQYLGISCQITTFENLLRRKAGEVGYEGEELEIGFNANYLLEVLRHIPSDEVKFAFKAPERAATIEPAGDDAPDYLCLVMPLRLLD